VAKNTDFYFTNQKIATAHLLLLHQSQLTKLLQMMESDAGTAKMEGTLNLADPCCVAVFEQKPIDLPGFSS